MFYCKSSRCHHETLHEQAGGDRRMHRNNFDRFVNSDTFSFEICGHHLFAAPVDKNIVISFALMYLRPQQHNYLCHHVLSLYRQQFWCACLEWFKSFSARWLTRSRPRISKRQRNNSCLPNYITCSKTSPLRNLYVMPLYMRWYCLASNFSFSLYLNLDFLSSQPR